ncbi:RNA polymerase I-specific transcription initiation factor RRN3-like [Lineus longissimus]|uniref:RNA polymerase I-specific transcription initiation factor RRN3-like n=1 Tax=Lineus longissimus TaxID=88925 RepID=UPI002B4E8005
MDVSAIVKNFKKGHRRDYDGFVGYISDPNIENSDLIQYLKGLRECISDLGKDCEYLIGALLQVNWAYKSRAVVLEYQTVLLNLISAHSYYLRSCAKMLVKIFLPTFEKSPSATTHITDAQREKDDQAFIHVHGLLQSIAKIVPLTPQVLMPVLVGCYPFVTKDCYIHACYVRNLLQIAQYMPVLRKQILSLIVEKMLELDALAPRQDIQEVEDDVDEDMNIDDEVEMFEMDSENEESTPPLSDTGQDEKPMGHKDANKLDQLMDILLQFIYSVCHPKEEFDWEAAKSLYKDLLYVFDAIILKTYLSCHVQYILFYITSFQQQLSDGFVDYLWKKVKDPNMQPIFRQSAVAYLASYVARAKYVSVSTARTILEFMVKWVNTYIKQASYSASQADVVHHGPFYSVCQAIFYIFIFRHKEFLAEEDGMKFCASLNFQTIVTCRLNPLRICLPVVVKTFSSIARQHQIAFCDTVIEHNNRSNLPLTTLKTQGRIKLSLTNALDSFFPFDPYLLARSQRHIEPLYRDYGGQPVVTTEEQISEDEDDFLPEEAPNGASLGKSPADFILYGTSPGFKPMSMM